MRIFDGENNLTRVEFSYERNLVFKVYYIGNPGFGLRETKAGPAGKTEVAESHEDKNENKSRVRMKYTYPQISESWSCGNTDTVPLKSRRDRCCRARRLSIARVIRALSHAVSRPEMGDVKICGRRVILSLRPVGLRALRFISYCNNPNCDSVNIIGNIRGS